MIVSYLTEEMKRHAMILVEAANYNDSKIAIFLKTSKFPEFNDQE